MDGWDFQKYDRFQLPHPDHLDEAHTAAVYTIQVQGNHLVSGSQDRSVRIWDIETQRLLADPLFGHEGSVLCLKFEASPAEDIIISGSTDSSVIIWRFSTGELMRTIAHAHDESVLSLAWDGRYLVTGSKDKSVKVWNRHTVPSHDASVPQFVRDAAPMLDEDLMLVEYSHLATLKRHQAAVNSVQVRGDRIASASGDRMLYVWSLQTGHHTHSFNLHQQGIACLGLTDRFAVTGSSDRSVKIVDIAQNSEVACLRGHDNIVRSVQIAKESHGEPVQIITSSYDTTVKFWQKDVTSGLWELKASLDYGCLQPSAPADIETLRAPIQRAFKVQLGDRKILCGGQGTYIEGWKFSLKHPQT